MSKDWHIWHIRNEAVTLLDEARELMDGTYREAVCQHSRELVLLDRVAQEADERYRSDCNWRAYAQKLLEVRETRRVVEETYGRAMRRHKEVSRVYYQTLRALEDVDQMMWMEGLL